MGNAGWWAAPSPVTEIGGAGGAVDTQPSDLSVLRKVSQQLVFHYRAGGDNADNGIARDRIDELDTRYADVMSRASISWEMFLTGSRARAETRR